MIVNKRIPSLDGIRMVSIAMVLLNHSYFSSSGTFGEVLKLISNGPLGVSIFFVLSGFLITTLLVRELETTGSISLRDFYIRRSFRIFPVYYAYLGVVVLLASLNVVSASENCLWSSALFLRNYFASIGDGEFTAHCWSLCVEEQFYIVWPPLLACLGRRRGAILAAGLIAFAPFSRALSYVFLPACRPEMIFLTHTRIDTLMFGCLAALLWDSTTFRSWLRRAIDCRLPWVAVLFPVVVSPWLADCFGPRYLLTVGYELEGACILLVILWLIERPDSTVGRILNHRAVAHLGIISFSLYLWQQLFLNKDRGVSWPIALIAALMAAEVSYWLVERPFLRLRTRLRLGGTRTRPRLIEQTTPPRISGTWAIATGPPSA